MEKRDYFGTNLRQNLICGKHPSSSLRRETLLLIDDVHACDYTHSKAFESLPICPIGETYVSGISCNLCIGNLTRSIPDP